MTVTSILSIHQDRVCLEVKEIITSFQITILHQISNDTIHALNYVIHSFQRVRKHFITRILLRVHQATQLDIQPPLQ